MILLPERSILFDMARDIDEKKKRKVLRKLRKAAERAEAENGPGLSDWEREFVDEVETRVEKYGSAFADPDKGNLDEPLSALQTRKLKEIDKKSRGKATGFKARSGFSKSKSKKGFTPRSRDIHDDIEDMDAQEVKTPPPSPARKFPKPAAKLKLVAEAQAAKLSPEKTAPTKEKSMSEKIEPAKRRGAFQIIDGGKDT
ncbi:MAG: hypothetical protein ABJG15_15160 [Hyphomonadaceae bacterium]